MSGHNKLQSVDLYKSRCDIADLKKKKVTPNNELESLQERNGREMQQTSEH